MIVLAATVIGTMIAEGRTFRVLRTPAGAWRIARQDDLERGLNYTGHGFLFGCFNGKVPDADETDTQCWRILGHAPVNLQRAMIEAEQDDGIATTVLDIQERVAGKWIVGDGAFMPPPSQPSAA